MYVVCVLLLNYEYVSIFISIGKQLEGIWHTGIVVFNREYYYGGSGIESCRPVSAQSHLQCT